MYQFSLEKVNRLYCYVIELREAQVQGPWRPVHTIHGGYNHQVHLPTMLTLSLRRAQTDFQFLYLISNWIEREKHPDSRIHVYANRFLAGFRRIPWKPALVAGWQKLEHVVHAGGPERRVLQFDCRDCEEPGQLQGVGLQGQHPRRNHARRLRILGFVQKVTVHPLCAAWESNVHDEKVRLWKDRRGLSESRPVDFKRSHGRQRGTDADYLHPGEGRRPVRHHQRHVKVYTDWPWARNPGDLARLRRRGQSSALLHHRGRTRALGHPLQLPFVWKLAA